MENVRVENIETYELVGVGYAGVSFVWWLFWMIICWPAVIIVALLHFKKAYTLKVVYTNGLKDVITANPEFYNTLCLRD